MNVHKRFEHGRDALLGGRRADPVGDRLHALVRVLDRDAVARPLEQLDVVLAVAERDRLLRREAEVAGQKVEARALRHARRRELEEVRQRLRDVQPLAEALPQPRRELVERGRVADADELRRVAVEPRDKVADGMDREVLEARVSLRLGRHARDVELVVDVDVRLVALGADRFERLAREPELDRHVPQPVPPASATTAPW